LVAIHCMSTLSLKMLFTDPSEISNMLATLQRFFYFQVQVPLLNPHFDLCCFLMDILGVPVPSEIRGIWKTTQNLFSTYCLLSKSSFWHSKLLVAVYPSFTLYTDLNSHLWTYVTNTPRNSVYISGNKEIYCIFKTCCINSVLFSMYLITPCTSVKDGKKSGIGYWQ
jgi:hypothetical protein